MTTAPKVAAGVAPSLAPRHPSWMAWLGLVVRLTLGVVAGWAGIAKMLDLPTSVRAVRAFQLLPEAIVPAVGYALPMVEIILAILLITGLITRYAAIVNGLIMLGFIFGISDRKSTRLNSSHVAISYAVFCLQKKQTT